MVSADNLSGLQEGSPFTIPKDSAHHLTCWRLCLKLFLWWGIYMSLFHRLLLWFQLILVIPHLISTSDVVQDTVTLSLPPYKSEHSVLFFCCDHLWDLSGENFVIFQYCRHHFQCIRSNIQLHAQFPSCNLFAQMHWSRFSSFRGMTFVHGHPEHGLLLTLLSPFLKYYPQPQCAHILISIVWSP